MTNAPSSNMTVEDMIGHYQRSIERSQHDPQRILHCIGKLQRMHVTVHHLQATGIGRTVNSLRKDGDVGGAAKVLISKWKEMVANEKSEGSEEERAQDGYGCKDEDENGNADEDEDDDDDDDDDDGNGDEETSTQLLTNSTSNTEGNSHKSREHISKSSSSSSNSNHHHHHRNKHASHVHRSPEKTNENQFRHRKYSSDDTQDDTAHSKHKHKSQSHNNGSGSSRKRENQHESIDVDGEHDRHKSNSKHGKEERQHRSRHETQHNGEENSDKKLKSSSKEHSKRSDHHHKSHSSSNKKTHSAKKPKRARDLDHTSSSSKKQKCDSTLLSSRTEEKKSSKSKFKHVDDGIEIDHSMGTSFAEALGMLQPIPSHSAKASASTSASIATSTATTTTSRSAKSPKKTASPSTSKNKTTNDKLQPTTSAMAATPTLLLKKPKLPPLEDLVKDLPQPTECIIPNDYRPSPINQMVMECVFRGPKSQPMAMLSETDSLCASTTSKNQRTKVYSGVKSGALLTVPPLLELCVRFLQKNIDALEYTGGVPFEILKPVLERASPEQLSSIEYYNPYLIDDSDVLWQQHCQRKFKAGKRKEMETWREMFNRCGDEQETLLNRLKDNIKKSQSVAMPVRQTKLAYVDSMVKPPRSIIKKQNQFGTHQKPIATPAARVDALSSVASNIAKVGDTRLKTLASMRDMAQAQPSNGAIKPKKAPLMAKTLQLMKGRFKR